jgi:predicted dinucleotide-binding enzyme
LCTPRQGTQQAGQSCGDFGGKVVIDATNPPSPDFSTLEVGTGFGFGLLRGRS